MPPDEAAALLRLLGHYSPSGREAAAVREFVRIGQELGLRCRVDRVGNGFAERGRGRPHTMFLGHIDTVEGRRRPSENSGRIHGRGAVDAKGPLAAALVAASSFSGRGRVSVVASVGEETDSRGARYLLRGPKPDAVIVGEPSGWDGLTIGYKGNLRLAVTFRGARTHWSSPSPTAADSALRWAAGVRQACSAYASDSLFRSLTVKVVGLSADPAADPEVAKLLLDVRIPPGQSTSEVLDLLPTDPLPGERAVLTRIEPVELPRTDVVVREMLAAIRAEGGEPTLYRKSGTSDLNLVRPVWNVPGVAYGPGDSKLDHTDRESVAIDELRRASAILGRVFHVALPASSGPTLRRAAGVP